MTDHLDGRWLLKMPDEDVDREVSSVAGGIFFHMWATRQAPYGAAQAMGHLVLGARNWDDDAVQHLRLVQELDDEGDLAPIATAVLANLNLGSAR